MGRKGQPLTEENYVAHELGVRWSEINTILRRIRRRRSGEPTERERVRLIVLKEQVVRLQNGQRAFE